MTHFSDGVRIGNIRATQGWNGVPYSRVNGYPSGYVMYYRTTPTAAAANNISLSQSPGAGAITLNGSLVTSGVATLDVPRCVAITSGSDDSGITFNVIGTDGYGNTQVETITGASGAPGTTNGVKAFKTVTSVTHTGSVAGTLTIGTTTKLGLPFRVLEGPSLITHQAGTVITPDAGTLVVGSTTDPQLATSNDPRGTYAPSGTLNGTNVVILGAYIVDPSDYAGIRGVKTYGG